MADKLVQALVVAAFLVFLFSGAWVPMALVGPAPSELDSFHRCGWTVDGSNALVRTCE